MAKTRQQMDTLVNTNISASPTDRITALEHNQVAREVLEYATGQVVAGGNIYFGNHINQGNIYYVQFKFFKGR